MTSIGRRCRDGNVYSRAILITQTLSGTQVPPTKNLRRVTRGGSRQRLSRTFVRQETKTSSRFQVKLFTLYDTATVNEDTKVAIARGLHLFPFRTEKLNLATPMILRKWESR